MCVGAIAFTSASRLTSCWLTTDTAGCSELGRLVLNALYSDGTVHNKFQCYCTPQTRRHVDLTISQWRRHTRSYQVKWPGSSKFWPGCLTWLFVYVHIYCLHWQYFASRWVPKTTHTRASVYEAIICWPLVAIDYFPHCREPFAQCDSDKAWKLIFSYQKSTFSYQNTIMAPGARTTALQLSPVS